MNSSIWVAIVENHPVFRHGLVGLVEDAEDLCLAGAAGSVPQLDAELTVAGRPDVVLLDLHLAGVGPQGRDAVALLRERGWRVLVVSASAGRETVLSAVAAGANGYISKDAEPTEIAQAIRTVAGGSSYISATLAGYLLDDAGKSALTPREIDILRGVARGDTDQDIADDLHISVYTVHSHLDRIRDKTGQRRRAELTRFAIERGLVPRSDHIG